MFFSINVLVYFIPQHNTSNQFYSLIVGLVLIIYAHYFDNKRELYHLYVKLQKSNESI